MKFYQNNKLVATLEKTSACLGGNKKTHKIEMLGNIWELKDDRNNLIDNLILDFEVKAFDAEMLMVVCKKFKRELALSDNEEVEIIADNQEELEQQRIVLDIKE
ncbi:hypothetical protein [uncultured Helicobacter sp.]|uniref:hypothetical protein n=1 Tax=uncultured Helicobacter sp. TaxID=175537 RepID=UPI00260A15B4|nr:hypothetical protein [uncultured Helicobacter sp.]